MCQQLSIYVQRDASYCSYWRKSCLTGSKVLRFWAESLFGDDSLATLIGDELIHSRSMQNEVSSKVTGYLNWNLGLS